MRTPCLAFGDTSPAQPCSCCCCAGLCQCCVPSWLLMPFSAHRLEGELNTVKQKRAAVQSTLRRGQKEQLQPSQQGLSPGESSPLQRQLWKQSTHPGWAEHLQLTHRHLQRFLWGDAFSSMAKNSWQDNLTPVSAIHLKSAALLKPLSSINSWRVFRISGGCAYPETSIKPAL